MSNLLANETVIDLTTVARVNILRGLQGDTNGLIADKQVLSMLIKMMSRDARMRIMHRAFQKATYTERFDIAKGQRDFWVGASPIAIDSDVDTDITIYHNTDQPRDFTNSADEIDADYIVCNPLMQRQGRIHIEKDFSDDYVDALQIEYTGGMATSTAITGTNGACSSTTFICLGKNFTTDGVAVGDTLAITEIGDADHGLHTIAGVGTDTLTVATAFSGTGSGLDYEIIDGGTDTIVGLYPHIADAMDFQIRFLWENRGRFGIQSEGIAGASVTHIRPASWLGFVRGVLEGEARRI